MDIREIYTEIITEESRNTKNKRYLNHPTHEEKGHNPSCGDEITLQLDIEDGIIKDASYVGVGCAISQASTSLMIDLIKGKTLEEAKELCETFLAMITEGLEGDELKKLKDAIALQNISTMPARVKCAVLAWHTLKNIIETN